MKRVTVTVTGLGAMGAPSLAHILHGAGKGPRQ